MKKIILFICFLALPTLAWVSTAPIEKNYSFKFKLNTQTYEYSAKSSSYEDAFEKAAQSCYKHFKGSRSISEDQGLEIIDVCANPRST